MNLNKALTIIGAVVLVTVFGFYMCTFQVRTTEVAVLKTFGKFDESDIITDAGLYYKWPWPMQSVLITDKRVRVMKDTYEETRTADAHNIMITTYVCWKVDESNPYLYHIASQTDQDRASKLRNLVQSEKKIVAAQYKLEEFVNLDPTKFKFDQIENDMFNRIKAVAKREYGIEVVVVGISQLSFPKAVSEEVFNRMKQEQEKKVADFRAEGEAVAQAVRARASAIRENIMAVADRLAGEIEAQANREVAEYYKELEKDVELSLFLQRIESTKQVLKERTTLILDSIIAPFGLVGLEGFGLSLGHDGNDLIGDLASKDTGIDTKASTPADPRPGTIESEK